MSTKFLFQIIFLTFWYQITFCQNAPVTKLGSVLDAINGSISIPVSVSKFENIGAFSLKITYDHPNITYNGFTAHPVFTGMQVENPEDGTILVEWTQTTSPVTLLDGSVLFELQFSYNSNSSNLNWYDDGNSCEYKDANQIVLNDLPTSDYYINGYVTDHGAPKTSLPFITDAEAGIVDVPVTVYDFWDIGSVKLAFTYDPSILIYTGYTPNTLLEDDMTVVNLTSTGGLEKISVEWTSASAQTLSDSSTLVTIHFTYVSDFFSNANYSEINWNTNGVDCKYKDSNNINLFDRPYDEFYFNGLVAGQLAPVTYLPVVSGITDGNNITIPVTVRDFQNISSLALKIEFDPSVLTFLSSTQNSIFGGALSINSPGSGEVSLSYFGTAVSLDDDEVIAEIEFNFSSGTSSLAFLTNGSDCAYSDNHFNKLYDNPYDEYYINGVVANQLAPHIKIDSTSALIGNQFSVPVTISDFNNIKSYSLTLDYDPSVLNYQYAIPNNEVFGDFNDNTTNSGRIQFDWSALNPLSLSDETILLYLNFSFNDGESPLIWYDNGTSCEFSAGTDDEILYDQPTNSYYMNGFVKPANFIWVGNTSTEWTEASNWSDNIVPNSQSVVSIPSIPPTFWPTFNGDFTLGSECSIINLDINSEMTVTGDMVINPGNSFVNAGSGILKVGGNWLNSGVFIPQTGKVIFTSQTGGFIPSGVLPTNEVQNYVPTTLPAAMTPVTGGISGPSGGNEHEDVLIGFNFTYAGTDYTQVRISTDGWLSLNLTGDNAVSFDNGRLFFNSDPTTVLAPWWDDLNADGSSAISYLTSGVEPNRIFTVEWKDLLSFSSGATARLNFQVKLYETTNKIEFCYGNVVEGTHNANEGASIGIKGSVGNAGNFIEATTASTNTVVTSLKSDSNWPAVNYQFTPPPDTVTFYNLTVGQNAILNVNTDVNIIGE